MGTEKNNKKAEWINNWEKKNQKDSKKPRGRHREGITQYKLKNSTELENAQPQLLYSLHNGRALLHKYTSTESRGTWPNPRVWSASPVVWGVLQSAVFWSARLGRVLPQHWRFPPASWGRPHKLLPPYEGLGLLHGASNKRNADGHKVF